MNHPTNPPGWITATAVVAGIRHRRNQAACQDVLRTACIGPRRLLVALGDGAGSAARGGEGAELATGAALAHLAAPVHLPTSQLRIEPGEAAVRGALAAARAAVLRRAEEQQRSPRDFATTLLVCVAEPDLVLAGQIGDGAIVTGAGDSKWGALTRPTAGEYLNETFFVSSEDALDRAQVTHAKGPVQELAVFSDGLQMLALGFAEGTPHAPFFKPLFGWLAAAGDPHQAGRDLTAFLHSPRVTDRTDDDLSLCLARWSGPPSA